MKLLLTADWQVDEDNLHTCNEMLHQLLVVCDKEKVDAVVHCGDIKQVYSPVAVRVVNFAVKAVRKIRESGRPFVALLGNHDRVGMFKGSGNWFPALQAAGAEIATQPKVLKLGGTRLFCLPFTSDTKEVIEAVKSFDANHANSILVFHLEIDKAKFNVQTSVNGSVLSVKDLQPEKFLYVVGGHFHMHQWLSDNVQYVGSPFAHDWGEVNQKKGFTVIDTSQGICKFIPTNLPRLFDPELPDFAKVKPASWEGHSVRIRVQCDGRHNTQQIQNARMSAEVMYPGAHISVIPEIQDEKVEFTIPQTDSDADLVKAYVENTVITAKDQDRPIKYLLAKLEEASQVLLSPVAGIEFIEFEGENILSFRRVKVNYTGTGIQLVTGRNEDREPVCSNGAGKSNYLALPTIALFGKTPKGQENDDWIRQGCPKTQHVYGKFSFRLPDKRVITIRRSRRPGKLQLLINDKDMSTGIGKRGTQAAIQRLTGLTWNVLVNSLFVDQREVNTLLRGTDKERKNLLSEFLRLSRFADAQELVKKDISEVKAHIQEIEQAKAELRSKISAYREFIAEAKSKLGKNVKVEVEEAKASYAVLSSRYKELCKKTDTLLAKEEMATQEDRGIQKDFFDVSSRLNRFKEEIVKLTKLETDSSYCPTCHRQISVKEIDDIIKKIGKDIKVVESEHLVKSRLQIQSSKKVEGLRDALSAIRVATRKCGSELNTVIAKFEAAKTAQRQYQSQVAQIDKYKFKLDHAKSKLAECDSILVHRTAKLMFLEYCAEAFSRNGIPACLVEHICPRLNTAAKHYSRLFCDNEIQVRFAIEDNELGVQVVNAHGGEKLKDQSVGETRLAGLIVSFALREVISTCNLLILDEPGEGLDRQNAGKFAEALLKLADSNRLIQVTSHNVFIRQVLEGNPLVSQVKLVKWNKVTTVVEK